jgi:hypothetical protein
MRTDALLAFVAMSLVVLVLVIVVIWKAVTE